MAKEATIQRNIVRYLKYLGAWCFKVHGSPYQRAGVPDLLCCHKGLFYAFEVKRPGERATPIQAHELQQVQTAGGTATVVTSVEDVQSLMERTRGINMSDREEVVASSGRYAAGTEVSTDKSKTEIERTLARYGADQFMYGWETSRAMIGFRSRGKMVRLSLPLPDRNSDEFLLTPSRKWQRSAAEIEKAYEQTVRQRWRALALVVKAKLEAVETGITTFEAEFLSYIVLPDNSTVGDSMLPQVEHAYLSGEMPRMLPSGKSSEETLR